jgi:choline dehydrogenase-like flavoprotein
MKDARIDTKEVVPPGDGDGEIRELLLALKEKEYFGFISIEPKGRPGLADPNFFRIAVRALKKLLKNIGVDWNKHSNVHCAGEIPISSNHINGASSKIHSSETVSSWIPLTSLEKMEQTDYDVIVIGSGAGGGAALWRLCDKWRNSGKKVGMIEVGDLLLPTNLVNLSLFTGERGEQYTSQIITPIGSTLPEFPGAKQIFALGGRTLQWTAASPRMPLYTLLNWPVTKKEMNHYYNIAEQVMNVNKSFTKSSSLTLFFLNQLWTNGFQKASEVPMAVDIKPTKYGEIHSNAIFSSILFLAEALNNKAFDLAVKARAVQLLIENGKTVAVKVMSPDMRSYFIKTKTIVLSASTLETPRLLLHSGIEGSAIGHYLLDHSALRAIGEMDRKRLREDLEPVRILIPNTKENPYQIQMTIQEQVLKEEVEIFIHSYGSVEPRYENKVFLDPKRRDEYGVPKIQVNYNYSNRDLAVIQQMAAGTRRAMESFGVLKGEPHFYLRPPGDDNHESGTCRMGIDPSTSAVNQYGQIHGISGLYVADNSVLPSLGANPTLTTVALAIRTADYIIQQFK